MIIEVLGLPASGKSTLVNSISEMTKVKTYETFFGFETDIRLKRSLKKLIFLLRHCKYTDLIILLKFLKLLSILDVSLKRKSILLVNFLIIKVIYSKYQNSEDLVILDQGQLQLAWSIFVDDNFKISSQLKAHLNNIKVSYIITDVAHEIYVGRFENRKWKKSVHNRYKHLLHCEEFQKSIDIILKYVTGCKRLELANEISPSHHT